MINARSISQCATFYVDIVAVSILAMFWQPLFDLRDFNATSVIFSCAVALWCYFFLGFSAPFLHFQLGLPHTWLHLVTCEFHCLVWLLTFWSFWVDVHVAGPYMLYMFPQPVLTSWFKPGRPCACRFSPQCALRLEGFCSRTFHLFCVCWASKGWAPSQPYWFTRDSFPCFLFSSHPLFSTFSILLFPPLLPLLTHSPVTFSPITPSFKVGLVSIGHTGSFRPCFLHCLPCLYHSLLFHSTQSFLSCLPLFLWLVCCWLSLRLN